MKNVVQVPTFGDTLRHEFVQKLSPFYQARLQAIVDHDFNKMKFKIKEELASKGMQHDDEFIDRGIVALQQYYAVAALDPHNMHAVSAQVDPFWHVHMLFSKDYTDLSVKIFGQYMHHDPLDHADQPKVEFVRKLYDYTLDVYTMMFTYYDEEMYPKAVTNADMICFHATDAVIDDPTQNFPVHAELSALYAKYN